MDIVLRQNGIPAAWAARQARISPSPNCMPHNPTGARASGSEAGLPGDRGGQLALPDIDPHSLAESDRVQAGPVFPQGRLGVRAVIRVLEERLRHPSQRQVPQILNTGDLVHRSLTEHATPSAGRRSARGLKHRRGRAELQVLLVDRPAVQGGVLEVVLPQPPGRPVALQRQRRPDRSK